jgi:hypothetical protein
VHTHSTATRTHRRTPTHAPAQVSPPERHSHSAACSQPAVATARLDCQPGVERGRLDSAHLALGDGIELGQEAAAVRKRRQGDQAAGRRAGRAAETKCILGAATCTVTRYLSGPVLKNAGESQSIQRSEHDHYVPEVVPRSPGQKAGRSAAPPPHAIESVGGGAARMHRQSSACMRSSDTHARSLDPTTTGNVGGSQSLPWFLS